MEMNHVSWIPDTGTVLLKAANKSRTGPLNKIGLTFVSAGVVLYNPNKSKHLIRFIGISENEGPYIKRPRAYLNYSYQLPLSNSVKLSAGFSLGIVQNNFQNANTNNDFQETMPDGQLSLGLLYKSWRFYTSALQILNNTSATEQNGQTQLKSYYAFSVLKSTDISPFFSIETDLFYRYTEEQKSNLVSKTGVLFSEKVGTGIVWSNNKGTSFYAEIKNLLQEFPISINYLYRSNLLSNTPQEFNHSEIGLSYRF